VEDTFADYLAQPSIAYNDADTDEINLGKIITQKWIASWSSATESWFDYRRTGLPDLQVGPSAKRSRMPLRFYYGQTELLLNAISAEAALDNLAPTTFSGADGNNSAWSKPWLIQGTGKPWE